MFLREEQINNVPVALKIELCVNSLKSVQMILIEQVYVQILCGIDVLLKLLRKKM